MVLFFHQWNLPPAASHKGVDKVFDFSGLKQPSKLSEDDRIERSRRMNVLHSRRKRERERIEIEVLHEHCDELRAKRQCLVREGERLQQLIGAAHNSVALAERGDVTAPLGSAIQPLPRQPGYGMPARYSSASLMESQRQRMSVYPQGTMQGQPFFSPSGMQVVAPTPQPVVSNYQLFSDQDHWNRPPISMQQQPQPPQAFIPYPNRQVNGPTSLPFASPPPPSQSMSLTAHPWPAQQLQHQQQLYAMPVQMPQQQYQLVPVPASYHAVGPSASMGGVVPAPVMMFGGGGGVDVYPDVAPSGGTHVYRLVGGGGTRGPSAPAPSF